MDSRVALNDDLLWCEDCCKSMKGDCSIHGLIRIPDRAIPSHAKLTLPCALKLQTVDLRSDSSLYGVFAKKVVQKLSNFGPAEGNLLDVVDSEERYSFKVFNSISSSTCHFLDTYDEDICNWMMFVRPATNASEQNLVAYQHKGCIYMTAVKAISPGTELKFWYARDYALLLGKALLRSFGTTTTALSQHERADVSADGDISATAFDEATSAESNVLTLRSSKPGIRSLRQKAASVVVRHAGWPCSSCDQLFDDVAEFDLHDCCPGASSRGTEQPATDGGRRTRNKRKGRPKKVMTIGGRKRRKGGGATVAKDSGGGAARALRKCPHCPLEFASDAKLAVHSFAHSGERPFHCAHAGCEKGFSSKFKLVRHELIHQPQKRYRCRFCDKPFSRRDHLKNHMVLHDADRRLHVCEYCRKPYSTLHAYRTHVAYHRALAGDLSCSVCLKEFESKDALVVHIKVHAGSRSVKGAADKKFCCGECDKRFFTQKDVRRHQVTHTKEKNFSCQFCPQRFGRQDHMTRHLKKNHGIGGDRTSATDKAASSTRAHLRAGGDGRVVDRTTASLSILNHHQQLALIGQHDAQPVAECGSDVSATGDKSAGVSQAPPEYVSVSVFPASMSPGGQHQQYFVFNGFGVPAVQMGQQSQQDASGASLSKRSAVSDSHHSSPSWQPVLVAAGDGQQSRYRAATLVSAAAAGQHGVRDTALILDCGSLQSPQSDSCTLRQSAATDNLNIHDSRGGPLTDGSANEYMEALKALGNFGVAAPTSMHLVTPQTIGLSSHNAGTNDLSELYSSAHYTTQGLLYR